MDEQTIFSEAIELCSAGEQAKFLDRVCTDDAVRGRVERLLKLHNQSDLLVDRPAVEAAVSDMGDLTPVAKMGETIGPYKLLEQIGEGGMGVVYMAEQREPVKRKVALKIIKPGMDTKQVIARFESERQALAMMEHSNIARVLDVGETESGLPYFVMELVRGVPITQYCDHENVDIRARLKVFIEVCRAVQHAHLKGVIHRDIKPSNVMVTLHDSQPVVKMIDFGVAKAMNSQLTDRTLFTNYAQIIGTPLYMSPEQAELSGLDVDTRSDIYSLGVLLYELLTGSTPFGEDRLREVGYDEMRRIIREEEPQKPSTRVSTLGAELETIPSRPRAGSRRISDQLRGELDWITIKSLEKKRDRRYQSAQEFSDDIRRYLDNEPVHACPPSKLYTLRKFASKHRAAVITTTLVLGLMVAGSIVSAVFAVRASRAEKKALNASEVAEQKAEIATAISNFLRNDLLRASFQSNADSGVTLRRALDDAAVSIDGRFAEMPIVEAELRTTLGLSYQTLGEIRTAKRHLAQASRLLTETMGADHRDTLKSTFREACLRTVYDRTNPTSDAERSIAAIDRFEEVLRKQEAALGKSDPDTLVTMGYAALCYSRGERYIEAMTLFDKANSSFAATLPKNDLRAVRCLEQTISSLFAQGRDDEAKALQPDRSGFRHGNMLSRKDAEAAVVEFTKLVHSRQLALGDQDPRTLEACTRLAGALINCRKTKEAERLLLNMLKTQNEHWGDDHESTIETRQQLADLYVNSNEIEKGAEHLKILLSLSDPTTKTLTYARVVAEMMLFKNKFSESAELRGKLAQAQASVFGNQDTRTTRSLRDQVVAYALASDIDNVRAVTNQLVERVGDSHVDTLYAQMWVGSILRKKGQPDDAEPVLQSAYALAKETVGPENKLTLKLGRILAMVWQDNGQADRAERLVRSQLAINEKVHGERHSETFDNVVLLGSICGDIEKLDEANKLSNRAIEMQKHLEEHRHQTLQYLNDIARLLYKLHGHDFQIDIGTFEDVATRLINVARALGKDDIANEWTEKLAEVQGIN